MATTCRPTARNVATEQCFSVVSTPVNIPPGVNIGRVELRPFRPLAACSTSGLDALDLADQQKVGEQTALRSGPSSLLVTDLGPAARLSALGAV